MSNDNITAGIICLDYVKLPLTITYSSRYKTTVYVPQHSIEIELNQAARWYAANMT